MLTILFAIWMAGAKPAVGAVQVDVNLNISAFFGIPRGEVDLHVQEGYAPEDVGRGYYVAREVGVPVTQILVLRHRGWAWGRIYSRYGLTARDVDRGWEGAREGRGRYEHHHGKAKGHWKREGGDDRSGGGAGGPGMPGGAAGPVMPAAGGAGQAIPAVPVQRERDEDRGRDERRERDRDDRHHDRDDDHHPD